MAAEPARLSLSVRWQSSSTKTEDKNTDYHSRNYFLASLTIRASHSMGHNSRYNKQLGMHSLKKEIKNAVLRAETVASSALELEEARRIKQHEMINNCDLWDDPVNSSDILVNLADTSKMVDALKDIKLKAEEVKLISELVDVEAINYPLFKQAYGASLDMSNFLDKYELSKLLKGPYDMEGACMVINAGSTAHRCEIWAKELRSMYTKWAEKLGYQGRLVEMHPGLKGGIQSVTIEFEFENAYGYLSGERGIHRMIFSQDGSVHDEGCLAYIDVVPIFLGSPTDIQIRDEDLSITDSSNLREEKGASKQSVFIKHLPTGITFHSSGERSHFANKLKALNRLKAKLLVMASEQKLSEVSSIDKDVMLNLSEEEVRSYISRPSTGVQDVKTGIQLQDLNFILDGNIEPLIAAHINMRYSS